MGEELNIGGYEGKVYQEGAVWIAQVAEFGIRAEGDSREAALAFAADAVEARKNPPPEPEPVPEPEPAPEPEPPKPPEPSPEPEKTDAPKERLFSPLAAVLTLAAVAAVGFLLSRYGGR